jgi:hypothetical protein
MMSKKPIIVLTCSRHKHFQILTEISSILTSHTKLKPTAPQQQQYPQPIQRSFREVSLSYQRCLIK